MKNNPDKAILERAKRFEAQALEEIFDCYSPGIYRYAFRLLGDTELARECMAETFSRFLNALKREGGPDNYLQAYLYRIAHNWITDHYRSSNPTIPLDSSIPDRFQGSAGQGCGRSVVESPTEGSACFTDPRPAPGDCFEISRRMGK